MVFYRKFSQLTAPHFAQKKVITRVKSALSLIIKHDKQAGLLSSGSVVAQLCDRRMTLRLRLKNRCARK